MHIEPVAGHTDLPGIGELGGHRHVQRCLKIGIVIDDHRRVAAEFHRHLLQGGGGIADHLLTDAGRSGQRHLAHCLGGHDRRIGGLGRADDKVHRARRQVARSAAIDHHHRHPRRLRRGAQDHRTARRKRWGHFPRDQSGGKVPGGKGGGNAHRFVMHFEPTARHAGVDDPAIDPACLFGEPAELVDGQRPFAARLRNRLAGFQRDHLRRLVGAALHFVGNGVQGVGAVKSRLGLPCRKACRSRCNGGLGIGQTCDRDLTQRLLRHRAKDRGGFAIKRRCPAAVDEQSKAVIHVSQPRWCGPCGPRPGISLQPRPGPVPTGHLQIRPRAVCRFQSHRQRRRFRRRTPRGNAR